MRTRTPRAAGHGRPDNDDLSGAPQNDSGHGDLGHADRGQDGEAAFGEYVTARGAGLLRMALLLTSNRADAEDLLQAALAKTYLAWDRIQDRAALDAYVKRAMVNTQISWWRRRRVEEFPTEDIPDRAVAEHLPPSELEDTVRRALDRLPRRMRAVVVLRYYEGMSEPEIADALGVSRGTVKSTVSRAVAKLRMDTELAGCVPGGPAGCVPGGPAGCVPGGPGPADH
jgi:RNA polymerase sigma-70 factor (sigma-E family)